LPIERGLRVKPMSFQTYCLPSSGSQCPPQIVWSDHKTLRASAEDIPALAATLVQLELLLKPQIADLEAITRLVLSDIGLTIQVLRYSRSEAVVSDELWRISDCVIHMGSKLLGLAKPLCSRVEDREHFYTTANAFWKHAKLIATVAEKTASYFHKLDVNPEQAYVSGLMYNLEQLPEILDPGVSPGFDRNACNLQEWVSDWNLPSFITDVLETAHDDIAPCRMSALPRVVKFARCWIDSCSPCSERSTARKSRFNLPVLQAANLINEYFPITKADPVVPFMKMLEVCTLDELDEPYPDLAAW
jgi:hypothetical protein